MSDDIIERAGTVRELLFEAFVAGISFGDYNFPRKMAEANFDEWLNTKILSSFVEARESTVRAEAEMYQAFADEPR